ncbi:hypothetical protein D3C72_1949830 [compost metagenome]
MVGQIGQIPGVKRAHADEGRLARHGLGRIDVEAVFARVLQRGAGLHLLAARVLFADADVLVARRGLVIRLFGGRQQARDHADGAAGVDDIGGRALAIARLDLDRRMGAAGGGSADQQGDVETAPLHLAGDEDHLV